MQSDALSFAALRSVANGRCSALQGGNAIKLPRRQFLHLAAGAASLPFAPHVTRAQAYPTKPITMFVPFAAGGGASAIARIVAERMRMTLGQPVIIENVGGANGSIGIGRVARSSGDGYMLAMGLWNTHVEGTPALGAQDTSAASCSKTSRARAFNWCRIAEPVRRCRIWWPDRST